MEQDRSIVKKLLKNPLAVVSIAVIIVFTLIALLGYAITPDKTPYANEQHLELAVKKPGFKVQMLIVHDKEEKHYSFFHNMLFGTPQQTTNIPISYYSLSSDNKTLYYTPFSQATDNNDISERQTLDTKIKYEIKQKTYPFGTDRYGRCLLSQMMIGTRVSLSVGFIAVVIALVIGITLGAVAGYYQGWADKVIMWIINVVWSVPTILLVIAVTFALGKGFWQVFVAVGLTMWVDIARMVRGQVMSIKEKEFILAGKALGFSDFRIIFRHILPNVVNAVTVIVASNFATAILQEAGLSFLGIGVQPPMPSWGTMIKENYGYIILDAAYMAVIPGIAIMLLVLAFFLLGSAIRQAMDIRNN